MVVKPEIEVPQPPQKGYFLESAIGLPSNSPSVHIEKPEGEEVEHVRAVETEKEADLQKLANTVNQKKRSIRRGIDEYTET